jgi:hypothetical protein
MGSFQERLNRIIPRLTSDELLSNSGLGNEIGFYIFDYPPRLTSDELLSNSGLGNEIGFYIFDYPPEKELEVRDHINFILSYLKKKRPDLRVKHINLFELIIDYLKTRKFLDSAMNIQRQKGDTALLKALKAPLAADKIARFFAAEAMPQNPGIFTGNWLRLFGRLKERNYYRAFRLVP